MLGLVSRKRLNIKYPNLCGQDKIYESQGRLRKMLIKMQQSDFFHALAEGGLAVHRNWGNGVLLDAKWSHSPHNIFVLVE